MLYSLRLSEIGPCFGQDWYYTLAPGRCCGIINWSGKHASEESIAPLMELFIVPLFPVSVSIAAFSSVQFSSVQFSHSVVSDSLRPYESQHARPPCPSPAPRVHSDSGPSSQWCYPAISSSVVHLFSCPQSLPASESSKSQLFAWGGQSTGVSASFNCLSHVLFTILLILSENG